MDQGQGQYVPQQHQHQEAAPEGYYDGDGVWQVFPLQPMVHSGQVITAGDENDHEVYQDDFEDAVDTSDDRQAEADAEAGTGTGTVSNALFHEQPSTSFGDELAASGEHDNGEYDPLEHSDMLDYSVDVPGDPHLTAPQSPEVGETTLTFNTGPSASPSPAAGALAGATDATADLSASESPIKAIGPILEEAGEGTGEEQFKEDLKELYKELGT